MQIDLELLSIQNPWWTSLAEAKGRNMSLDFDPIIEAYNKHSLKWQPNILEEFSIKSSQVYALFGARGVGKTTIIKLLINKLIKEKKVIADNIFYYSCHNLGTYEQLNELIKIFLFWRRQLTNSRLFIFIDEITLIKQWRKGINYLIKAKKFKNATVLLSGSVLPQAGLTGSKKNKIINKIVKSLDFTEFLKLLNHKLLKNINKSSYLKYSDQLEYYLDIYFLTGGFISAINSYKDNGAVKQDSYSNYLYWLIADMAKLGRDIVLMRQIIEQVLLNLGQPVGYKTIAKKTKAKTHLTAADYLEILQSMFATKTVYQSDASGKPTSRKAKKVYFRDPFLFWLFYSYIYGSVDYWQFSRERLHREDIFFSLVETVVFSHLIKGEATETWGERVTYWRDNIRKLEINFLVKQNKKLTPVLIRYQQEITKADKNIFKQAGFKRGVIISKDKLELKGAIKIMPLTYFLLFFREYL